jgi:hypothetical protein
VLHMVNQPSIHFHSYPDIHHKVEDKMRPPAATLEPIPVSR